MGNSDELKKGSIVMTLGHPMRLMGSFSAGHLSGIGRSRLQFGNISGSEGSLLLYQDFIQTTAQIHPGNSGGPLFNIKGEVIGINNAYDPEESNIGFAIPINIAKSVVEKIQKYGYVSRGYAGFAPEKLDRDIADIYGLKKVLGVIITLVEEGSPADKAGIKKGDVIVKVNGKDVQGKFHIMLEVSTHDPGDTVTFDIIRNKKRLRKTVVLREHPITSFGKEKSEETVVASGEWLGLKVVSIDDWKSSGHSISIKSGVVIATIQSGSPAADRSKGIRPGLVIRNINRDEIENMADYNSKKQELKDKKRGVLLYVEFETQNGIIGKYVGLKP